MDLHRREGIKILIDNSMETASYTQHNRTDTHMNSETVKTHTQDLHMFKPYKISALKRNGYKVPVLIKRYLLLILLTKRKICFLQYHHWACSLVLCELDMIESSDMKET